MLAHLSLGVKQRENLVVFSGVGTPLQDVGDELPALKERGKYKETLVTNTIISVENGLT